MGKADITPPTGYLMLGWARGDARAMGQQTRLYARAMVLRRGARRLVLVSEDLNMVAGGMVQQAARSAGFGERDVIVQATHTHAGPTGYSNFLFKDRAFPTPKAPKAVASEPDPRLYTFMVHRLALAIRRANADRRPAAAAWGTTRLLRVTRNRSIEAHLADHGVERAFGTGKASEDPLGPLPPDRRGRERAPGGPATRRPARARWRVGGLRQPRHGEQVDVPVLQRRPRRRGAPRVRGGAAPGRPSRARPGRGARVRERRRRRRVGGTRSLRSRRRRVGGAPRGRRDALRLARSR